MLSRPVYRRLMLIQVLPVFYMTLAVLWMAGAAEAQQLSYQRGVVSLGPPRVVNMASLPQMTAAPQTARSLVPSRPQNGVSDAVYAARKARAVRQWGGAPA